MTEQLVTLYEVYDKRVLHQPMATLPLLDRDTDVKKATSSARAWGGVVMKVQARILQQYPLVREVRAATPIFVHYPRPTPLEPVDRIGLRELKGKLRDYKHLDRPIKRKGFTIPPQFRRHHRKPPPTSET